MSYIGDSEKKHSWEVSKRKYGLKNVKVKYYTEQYMYTIKTKICRYRLYVII